MLCVKATIFSKNTTCCYSVARFLYKALIILKLKARSGVFCAVGGRRLRQDHPAQPRRLRGRRDRRIQGDQPAQFLVRLHDADPDVPDGRCAADGGVLRQAALRFATPNKFSRPEPNNQTAAGTGTTATSPSCTAPVLSPSLAGWASPNPDWADSFIDHANTLGGLPGLSLADQVGIC